MMCNDYTSLWPKLIVVGFRSCTMLLRRCFFICFLDCSRTLNTAPNFLWRIFNIAFFVWGQFFITLFNFWQVSKFLFFYSWRISNVFCLFNEEDSSSVFPVDGFLLSFLSLPPIASTSFSVTEKLQVSSLLLQATLFSSCLVFDWN